MKKIFYSLLLIFLIIFVGCDLTKSGNKDKDVVLDTKVKKVSYIMGYDYGTKIEKYSDKLDYKFIIKGIKDGLEKNDPKMNRDEMSKIMRNFLTELQKEREELAEINKKLQKEFLEKNAKKEDVKTTESGLQYKIIKKGTGESPTPEDTVKVHYKGTLINGEVFDSSYKRGKPAVFQLNKVIKGWTEGVQLMSESGKWKFFIPSEIAYGTKGAGDVIGPNEVLIFEVELLDVIKKGQEEKIEK